MTTYDNAAGGGRGGGNPYDNTPVIEQTMPEPIVDKGYMTTFKGLIKAGEIVLDCVLCITTSVWESKRGSLGGGWAQFVCTTALLLTAIQYVLYLFRLPDKIRKSFPSYDKGEFFFYCGVVLCYFITFIVAVVFAARHPSIAASSFFCFVAMVVYGVDCFFAFAAMRQVPQQMTTHTGNPDPGHVERYNMS